MSPHFKFQTGIALKLPRLTGSIVARFFRHKQEHCARLTTSVTSQATMITPTRVSYAVLAITIILAKFLHLGAPLLVVLFSYFALRQLYFVTRRKWLALSLFIIAVTGIAAAGVYFTRAAVLALPDVADSSIPSASAWAQKRQIELPFSDFDSLRQVVVNTLGEEANYLRNVANVAKATTTNLVFSILGIVAAASLFFKTG